MGSRQTQEKLLNGEARFAQIVANAVLSPKIIRCLGLKNTLMLGTTCIGVGILYPLVDSSFVLQLLLWLPLVAVSGSRLDRPCCY